MNETLKNWIEVLRSGDYKQTQGSLISENRDAYCCLGVFCEEQGFLQMTEDSLEGFEIDGRFSDSTVGAVQLHKVFPDLEYIHIDVIERMLTAANDNGHSFEEIADFLEGLDRMNTLVLRDWLEGSRYQAPIYAFGRLRKQLNL